MLQTTTLTDAQRGRLVPRRWPEICACQVEEVLPELVAKGVKSLFLLYNDEVTDAARPNAEVVHLHGPVRWVLGTVERLWGGWRCRCWT